MWGSMIYVEKKSVSVFCFSFLYLTLEREREREREMFKSPTKKKSTRRRIETDEVAFGRSSQRVFDKDENEEKRSPKQEIKLAVNRSLALEAMMNKRQKMNCGKQVRFIWTVYRISHIDCISQEFDIDIRFLFEWQDSSARVNMTDEDRKRLWYPRLIVANKAEDMVSEPVDPMRHINVPNDGYVRMKMRIKGKMQEIYELADFPFDTQVYIYIFMLLSLFFEDLYKKSTHTHTHTGPPN